MSKVYSAETKIDLIKLCQREGIYIHLPGDYIPTLGGTQGRCFLETMENDPSEKERNESGPAGWAGGNAIQVSIPVNLFDRLTRDIKNPEDPLRAVCSQSIVRSFVYFDISDFSKFLPGQQALVISSFVALTNMDILRANDNIRREADLCIGDGYIFVFQRPLAAVQFACLLASHVDRISADGSAPVEYHFRMGIHTGEVNMFWDPGKTSEKNYVGEGINGGSRVLEAIGKDRDDAIFISDAVKKELLLIRSTNRHAMEILSSLSNMGRKKDKHENPWRVWMLDYYKYINNMSKSDKKKKKSKNKK